MNTTRRDRSGHIDPEYAPRLLARAGRERATANDNARAARRFARWDEALDDDRDLVFPAERRRAAGRALETGEALYEDEGGERLVVIEIEGEGEGEDDDAE